MLVLVLVLVLMLVPALRAARAVSSPPVAVVAVVAVAAVVATIAPASRHSPGSAASAPLYSPSRSSDVPPGCRTLPVFSGSAAIEANTAKVGITEDQKSAVLDRRFLDLLKLGANVYYAFKLISFDRQPPQVMYGQMAEPRLTFDEFQRMMIDGGRPIDGNRSVEEWKDG